MSPLLVGLIVYITLAGIGKLLEEIGEAQQRRTVDDHLKSLREEYSKREEEINPLIEVWICPNCHRYSRIGLFCDSCTFPRPGKPEMTQVRHSDYLIQFDTPCQPYLPGRGA